MNYLLVGATCVARRYQSFYHSIQSSSPCNNLILHVTHILCIVGSYIYITGLREASDRGLAMVLLGFLMFTPGR